MWLNLIDVDGLEDVVDRLRNDAGRVGRAEHGVGLAGAGLG
jgi:hypothetical protein